jgi:hypothetical protein
MTVKSEEKLEKKVVFHLTGSPMCNTIGLGLPLMGNVAVEVEEDIAAGMVNGSSSRYIRMASGEIGSQKQL